MRITMVGTGYVGLVTGTCFANTGNHVTCLDVDEAKIEKLRQGRSPIFEPGLEELIHRNAQAGRLRFTTDKAAAYDSAEMIFISVGTPGDAQGRADLKYILAAARDIGDAIENGPRAGGESKNERRAKIVVIKSTVPVGTNARVRAAIAGRTSKPFKMASNPEFLKEGAAISDFMKPDRVVIGAEDAGTGDRLRDLYEPFVRQGNPIFVMDIPSAEMVKYASNAMLATKISFINEIANLCESYDADVDEVRRGMCADARIGNQFLYPGLGYGGSCFPKDVLACISMGLESQTPTDLLAAVHQVNQRQRDTFMAKIRRFFNPDPAHVTSHGDGQTSDHGAKGGVEVETGGGGGGLAGRRIAVWGIAFKPGTDDIREAPAITLMRHLLDAGAHVVAHDPVAEDTAKRVEGLGDRITYAATPEDTLEGADALMICTDWAEFQHPDFDVMKAKMRQPVIFDGRNLYRPSQMREAGFTYFSIGRNPITPPAA